MKSLTIEIPAGYEIDSFDKASGSVKFKPKPKDVISAIRTVEDVLKDNGLTQDQFDKQCAGLEVDERAYRILKLLAKSLNEGWQPNWDNSDEYKYVPWFYMGGSSGFRFHDGVGWSSRSNVGSLLCFKSRELAVHAGTYFLDTYRQFMVIE